ncbi:MmgE/PrpD family protein [Gulosibacter sp. 10]|uniref:MmgE/PrpD family protein n=1 Tax=Gulosibacter sp. 10 TaxID=1255570 RepID=UPI00097EE71B|nr:MmgE/PrpD family protein [Gulosibacter sp. 10]SJM51167.1 MmgE/PrpD family protein [Gulosibacter sp. 10]
MPSLAARIARRVLADEDREPPRAPIIQAIADTLAVSFAACRTPIAARLRDFGARNAEGAHPVLGAAVSAPAREAAFRNAALAHALDFDDMTEAIRGHLSSVMLPVLFTGIDDAATGLPRQLASAYSAGFEAARAIAAGVGLAGHYSRGWHSTGTLGTLAATAALAKLRGVDPPVLVNALGIAASSASGLRANFGSDTKALHAGFAAARAIDAVDLAQSGMTANPAALDGPSGFLELFGEHGSAEAASAALQEPVPAVVSPGINIKLFPCCYELQRTAHAAMRLRDEIRPDSIDRIDLLLNRRALEPLRLSPPTSSQQAQFSPSFVVALALVRGRLDLEDFTEGALDDRRVLDIMERTSVHAASAAEADGVGAERFARLTVGGAAGTRTITVVDAPGSAQNPVSDAQLDAKIRSCLDFAGAPRSLAGPLRRTAEFLAAGGDASPLRRLNDEFLRHARQDRPATTPRREEEHA